MTERTTNLPPLGVGALISDTFSVFFSRIPVFLVLSLLSAIISVGGQALTLGFSSVGSFTSGSGSETALFGSGFGYFLVSILSGALFLVSTAAISYAAYDSRTSRRGSVGTFLAAALTKVVPLCLCAIVSGIMISLGLALFLLPGLWVFAVYSVVSVAIVAERGGFYLEGLGRSIELTKVYRWPIAGGAILAFVVMGLLVGLLFFVLTPLTSAVSVALTALVSTVIWAFSFSVLYIWIGVLYARLRAIKDGSPTENLDEVFG